MPGDDLRLHWRELRCEAPSTRAFRLEGALVAVSVATLTAELGRLLQPKPRRLLLDVQGLARIDRTGLETLAGMAGFFAEDEGGHIAFIAAAPLLREKLEPLAEPGSVRFYASFSQAAVRGPWCPRLSGSLGRIWRHGCLYPMRTAWERFRYSASA